MNALWSGWKSSASSTLNVPSTVADDGVRGISPWVAADGVWAAACVTPPSMYGAANAPAPVPAVRWRN